MTDACPSYLACVWRLAELLRVLDIKHNVHKGVQWVDEHDRARGRGAHAHRPKVDDLGSDDELPELIVRELELALLALKI